MHSLRTKITLLTLWVVAVAVSVVTLVCVVFIRHSESREAEQLLLLMCETGEKNLDYYFNSVQKSVERVSRYIEEDLDGLDYEHLSSHVNRAEDFFETMVYRTNGVLTYYYRIDPEVSDKVKGFWFTNLDGEGFKEHEVTDITLYDTKDTSQLVWFTVPKFTGKAIWQPPYVTDNLDVRVFSYNVPIYFRGQFVGVVGIELDYSSMAGMVESIRLYRNGYAFLSDENGNLFYHPRIDVTQLAPDAFPKVPEGMIADSTLVHYFFEGVEKKAVWLPLSNGMRLYVTVSVFEADGDWQRLISIIMMTSLIVLLSLGTFTLFYTRRITKPLEQLTMAAEKVDRGDYDFVLEYDADDEVGRLTRTFKELTDHVRDHIDELSKRVYLDALTSVKNKGAFNIAIERIQSQIDAGEETVEFAVGMFDCDELKLINDMYGHAKGDVYLKTACRIICRVFKHSPVYRIGGDEFAVIMRGDDYEHISELSHQFEKAIKDNKESASSRWEQVSVSMGIAVYSSDTDKYVLETVQRADKAMYAQKREKRNGR